METKRWQRQRKKKLRISGCQMIAISELFQNFPHIPVAENERAKRKTESKNAKWNAIAVARTVLSNQIIIRVNV